MQQLREIRVAVAILVAELLIQLFNPAEPLKTWLTVGGIAFLVVWLVVTFVPWSRMSLAVRRWAAATGTKLGKGEFDRVKGFVDVNHETYVKAIALSGIALDNLGNPPDPDTAGRIVRVSYQHRMDDAEQARGVLFDRLSRKARGVPEAFDAYYRQYQAMRTSILDAFALRAVTPDWVGYVLWHVADQSFLGALRSLVAAPGLERINQGVAAAGWGEGITSKLPPPQFANIDPRQLVRKRETEEETKSRLNRERDFILKQLAEGEGIEILPPDDETRDQAEVNWMDATYEGLLPINPTWAAHFGVPYIGSGFADSLYRLRHIEGWTAYID